MTDEQNNKHIAATSAPPTAASTPATTLQELHNASNGSATAKATAAAETIGATNLKSLMFGYGYKSFKRFFGHALSSPLIL